MILYGQSSGNDMVQRYSYAYPDNSLVRGFIGESGGTPVTNPTSSPNFHNAAQIVGCANLTDMAELACMQQADPMSLQHAVDAINPDPNRGLFRPIADNITTFTNLTERLEKGLIAKLVSPFISLSRQWRYWLYFYCKKKTETLTKTARPTALYRGLHVQRGSRFLTI